MIIIILLYLYPLMGLIHVISAIVRYFSQRELYPGYHKRITNYLLGVIIYFLILGSLILLGVDHSGFYTLYIGFIPWLLAAYFWNTLYRKAEIVPNEEAETLPDTEVGFF